MGARPSSFKKGGGFLDGVDSTITDFQYTDAFNGEAYDPKKKIKDFKTGKPVAAPHSLFVLLSVRVDGADEDTTTTLKAAGDFDEWEVSDDGHNVTPNTDNQAFPGGTPFAKFITSLVKPTDGNDGFPEDRLPEDTFDYTPIIGTRIRTTQQVDEARNNKFGPKTDKKTGKQYDRKDLLVETVYELPETAVKAASKSASAVGKASPAKVTIKAAGKPNGKAIEVAEEDIKDLSGRALLEILEASGGHIIKGKLSVRTLQTPLLKGNGQREDVRKWLFDDDNLDELVTDGLITYNRSKQEIEAVA